MSHLWTIFSILDLFKRPLHFTLEKKELTSTKFGFFLSCLIYVLLVYFFLQSDFILKAKPTILTEIHTEKEAPLIKYKGFPLAITVKDKSESPSWYDQSIFSLKVEATRMDKDSNGTQMITEERYFHVCNETDTQNPDELETLKNYFCLDDNYFEIEGLPSEKRWQVLKISLLLCENSTEGNNNSCKSSEEISKHFEMKSFGLAFVTSYFQPKNYENPIGNRMMSNLYKLDSKMNKLMKINLQKLQITTDETVIFDKNRIDETFTFESEASEIGTIIDSNEIFTILFYSSHTVTYQSRMYQSLIDSIAVLGGMLNILVSLGALLSKLEKSVFLTVKIMNFLYSFKKSINTDDRGKENSRSFFHKFFFFWKSQQRNEQPKEENRNMSIRNSKCILPMNLINKKYKEIDIKKIESEASNMKISSFSIKKMKTFKEENNSKGNLNFGFLQYIKLFFKQLFKISITPKEKVFLKAKGMYERETDIVSILKKAQEVEKLKFLLLNEKQIALFDLLEKPMLFADGENKMEDSTTSVFQKRNSHLNEVGYKYYLELEEKHDMDSIDKKLFLLVNSKFKNFKKYFKN